MTDIRHLNLSPLPWRAFVSALCLTTLIVAALWSILHPLYLDNEDVYLRLAVEGRAYPGEPPTGYLVFTHSGLGWTAVALQRALPGLSVWDVLITVPLVWGLAALFALTWHAFRAQRVTRTAAMLALVAVTTPLIGGFQYTISATLAGGAATMIALVELMAAERPRVSMLGMAGALLFVGLLLRAMAAEAGVLSGLLLLVPLAWSDETRRRRHAVRAIAACGLVAALVAALAISDSALYARSPLWSAFYQHHWRIVTLAEWEGGANGPELDAIRAAAGWSSNDWNMLRGWWGVDPTIFGFDRVARAAAARVSRPWDVWLSARLAGLNRVVIERLLAELAPLLSLAAVIMAGVSSRRRMWSITGVFAIFAGIYLGIQVVFKEPPFRLIAPLEATLMLAVLVTIGGARLVERRLVSVVALAVAAGLAARQAGLVLSQSRADQDQAKAIEQQVQELLTLRPSLLVMHADSFPAEQWWRPFGRPPIALLSVPLGWDNQHPDLQHFLSATHHQPLLRAICADPSIFVIAESGRLEAVTISMREHFGADVAWSPVYEGSFRAWRCSPASPSTRSSIPDSVAGAKLQRQ